MTGALGPGQRVSPAAREEAMRRAPHTRAAPVLADAADEARDEILRAIDAILRHTNHQPARERGPVALEIYAAFHNRGWRPTRKEKE